MLKSKFYGFLLVAWFCTNLVGLYNWLCVWFLPSKNIVVISIFLSAVLTLVFLLPMIIGFWNDEVVKQSQKVKLQFWVVRIVSPLAFFLLFWFPTYFFTTL